MTAFTRQVIKLRIKTSYNERFSNIPTERL